MDHRRGCAYNMRMSIGTRLFTWLHGRVVGTDGDGNVYYTEKPRPGTRLVAKFDRIDGLSVGSDVRVAGVKVGSISATAVDPKTFQANVAFTVQPSLKIPRDSSAEVTSDGLLGGKFIALVPGGDDK